MHRTTWTNWQMST